MKKKCVVAKVVGKEEIEKGLCIDAGAIVIVEHIEAFMKDEMDEDGEAVPVEQFCPALAIGKVVSADKTVICLASSIVQGKGADLVVIPLEAIEKIEIIKAG